MALKINNVTVIDDNRNVSLNNLAVIQTPTNVSPANNSINVWLSNALVLSNYSHAYNVEAFSTEFQLSNNFTFTDIYFSSGNIRPSVNTSTIDVQLLANTTYFFRGRYSSVDVGFNAETNVYSNSNVVSAFSEVTQYTTGNVVIQTPTLQVTGAPNNVGETPTLTLSSFAVTGNAGVVVAHQSTDWQVLRASNNQIVFERLANTVNLTSIVVPAATLEISTQYCFRARQNANVFGSSAFTSNLANTISQFPPTVLGESFGGGFYTGTICAASTCYYLILSPNSSGCAVRQWKTQDTGTHPTDGSNGFLNTYTYLNNFLHPAGCFAATRTINGFSDWYLPASGELGTMIANRACMPSGEGYNEPVFYWSSTEGSPNSRAVAIRVCNSDPSSKYKTESYTVRAIRRVPF